MAVTQVNESDKRTEEAEEAARDVVATTRDVANEVAERASAVASRLPEAAATTRNAVEEATRRMESGSDEALAVGASLSTGLAIGLLLGGANRLLVVLALIPATAMSFTLLDRYAGGRLSGTGSATPRRGS
jgi:chemotaxis response regulator CheB